MLKAVMVNVHDDNGVLVVYEMVTEDLQIVRVYELAHKPKIERGQIVRIMRTPNEYTIVD
jgi:hypothetical protein